MNMRARLAVLAIGALVGGAVVGAAPASAAIVGDTIECDNPNGFYTATPIQIVASPGDTIVITGNASCNTLTVRPVLDPVVSSYGISPEGVATLVLAPDAPPGTYGSSTLGDQAFSLRGTVRVGLDNGTRGSNYYLTIVSPRASAATPEWVQGYGRTSATEACQSGWSASWEQWPNGGTGGWVCTRSVPAAG